MLAALDCVFHSSNGLERVRSMFTEYNSGIELRIKRNKFTENMLVRKNTGVFKTKYYHLYEEKTDSDVFMITNNRLNAIDAHSEGVQSNSLAVKVFEHILSYYYDIALPGDEEQHSPSKENADPLDFDSFSEHNRKNRLHGQNTESEFFACLFEMEQFFVAQDRLGSIIMFKQDYFKIPVYVALTCGTNLRHAYRIQQIELNTAFAGGFEFLLLDPWNNTATKSFSLEQIREGNPFFVIFNWIPELRGIICNALCIPDVSQELSNPQRGIAMHRNHEPYQKLLLDLHRWFCFQIKTDTLDVANTNLITKYFLIRMLAVCNISTAFQLMECLFVIDHINKELASILFQLAKDNIPNLFLPKISYYDLSCDIFRSSYYEFKEWFKTMDAPTAEIPGAHDIFVFRECMVYELNKLEVSYTHCASKMALENHKKNLHKCLDETVARFTIRPGFANALDYPEIMDAYNTKKRRIDKEADTHLPHMLRKNNVVQSVANLKPHEKHRFFGNINSMHSQQLRSQTTALKINP